MEWHVERHTCTFPLRAPTQKMLPRRELLAKKREKVMGKANGKRSKAADMGDEAVRAAVFADACVCVRMLMCVYVHACVCLRVYAGSPCTHACTRADRTCERYCSHPPAALVAHRLPTRRGEIRGRKRA